MTTIQQVVKQITAAHDAVKTARAKHVEAAHQRNLAGIVLVRRYKAKAATVYQRMGVSKSLWDQQIVPRWPVDSELPDWSKEEAERIIDKKVEEIVEASTKEAAAAKIRIAGVHALSKGQIDKMPWINSQIAASTGLSKTQVGDDLKATPPPIDLTATTDTTTTTEETPEEWAPLPVLADRLGTLLERMVAALEESRTLNETVPASGRGRGRLLVFDPEEMTIWWEKGGFGWWTVRELAEKLPNATYDKVRGRLRTAKANGTESKHAMVHGVTRYEPAAAKAWWASTESNLGRRTGDGPDTRGLTITQLADALTEAGTPVTRDQVKQKLRAARDKGTEPQHVVNEAGHRLYDRSAFGKFWRGE
jgi:hypothetical protein